MLCSVQYRQQTWLTTHLPSSPQQVPVYGHYNKQLLYQRMAPVLGSIHLTLQILVLLSSLLLYCNPALAPLHSTLHKEVITSLYIRKVWRQMRM